MSLLGFAFRKSRALLHTSNLLPINEEPKTLRTKGGGGGMSGHRRNC